MNPPKHEADEQDQEAHRVLLQDEITELERRLLDARRRLHASDSHTGKAEVARGPFDAEMRLAPVHPCSSPPSTAMSKARGLGGHDFVSLRSNPINHALLLLSDSALPLGSFAFSSGLESYLAHQRHASSASRASSASSPFSSSSSSKAPATSPSWRSSASASSFEHFLNLSLSSMASTALPYVLAGHRSPERILGLDDEYDASLPCTVARRASVAQGKALLTIWHRSFRASFTGTIEPAMDHTAAAALEAIDELRRISSSSSSSSSTKAPNAAAADPAQDPTRFLPSSHFPPLWGAITKLMAVSERDAAYVFLLNHVKAVVSAAVRANVLGPYQAQAMLIDRGTRDAIARAIDANWDVPIEEAAQTAPVLDLWVGRHELLYSRIFNS